MEGRSFLMAATSQRSFCVGLFAAALCCHAPSVVFATEDWPAFRGGDRQGVNLSAAEPTTWSADSGYDWKTPIPGQGNSSPVVVGDRIYVTTGYPAQSREWAKNVFVYLSAFFCVLMGIGMLRVVVRDSSVRFAGASGLLQFLTTAAFLAAGLVVMFLIFFGPSAIDYERCQIRAWLGSSILVGLCVLMTEFQARPGSPGRLLVGIGAIFFSILAFVLVPASDHAFRGGYFNASAATVWASTLIAFLAGSTAIFNYLVSRRMNRADLYGSPSSRLPGIAKLFYGAAFGISLLASAGIGALIVRQRPAPGEETTWAARAVPYDELAYWLCGVLPVLLGAVLLPLAGLCRVSSETIPRRPAASLARVIATIALVGLGFIAVGATLSHLVKVSPFLHYHLANPRWRPVGGWTTLYAVASICGLWLLYELSRLKPQPDSLRSSRIVPAGFRLLLLALAIGTFIRVNVLSSQVDYARAIICLDKATGKPLWTCEGLISPEGQLHKINSPASSTPVVHADRVFAFFGYGGVMAADASSGKLLWQNPDVRFFSIYGAGVSPVVFENRVIIVNATPINPTIHALDCATGKPLWSQPMPRGDRDFPSGNSRTPPVRNVNGRPTILVWDYAGLTGHDPKTGEKLWAHPIGFGGEGDLVATIVTDGKRVYCCGPSETIALELAKLDKSGVDPIAWRTLVAGSNCSSPVLHNGRLYFTTDHGVAVCLDAETGDKVWRERLKGTYYASPVATRQYVYFTSEEGLTTILDATSPQFKVVAKPDFKTAVYASFALLPDCLLARTDQHLYRIGPGQAIAAR
jgi:outer membrane protein assembly factor BamB